MPGIGHQHAGAHALRHRQRVIVVSGRSLLDRAMQTRQRVVDRLLLSPHYGERMAVDWLDAARFVKTAASSPATNMPKRPAGTK